MRTASLQHSHLELVVAFVTLLPWGETSLFSLRYNTRTKEKRSLENRVYALKDRNTPRPPMVEVDTQSDKKRSIETCCKRPGSSKCGADRHHNNHLY